MADLWFKIELTILLIVIAIQIFRSIKIYLNIKVLRGIFSQLIEIKSGFIERKYLNNYETVLKNILYVPEEEMIDISDNSTVKISIAETKGTNEIIVIITIAINNYLVNNYGAVVNFSIIKDIIDREVDAKDEEISLSIPTPLYLGLAASMVGIICGLFAMQEIGGANFTTAINSLISGVKYAMSASLVGLACTTFLSSILYKKAKKKILKEKNQQISYLLAKLLPELIKAEDTGVAGLKASLDRFAREATKIVESINSATLHTGMNIKAQHDLISKIENMNMLKISTVNLELFNSLDHSMEALNKFGGFLNKMEVISSNLEDFASKTTNIDNISGKILSTMEESQKLTRFLTSHLDKIEAIGETAVSAVSLVDSNFRIAIDNLDSTMRLSMENLNKEILARIVSMSTLADNTESTFTEIFKDIEQELENITSHHLDKINAAFSNIIPKFEQLDELKPIREIIEAKLNIITSKHVEEIIKAFDNASPKLDKLDELKPIREAIEAQAAIYIASSSKNNDGISSSIEGLKNMIVNSTKLDNTNKVINQSNKNMERGKVIPKTNSNENFPVIDQDENLSPSQIPKIIENNRFKLNEMFKILFSKRN